MDKQLEEKINSILDALGKIDSEISEIRSSLRSINGKVDLLIDEVAHIKKWTYSNQNSDILDKLNKISGQTS